VLASFTAASLHLVSWTVILVNSASFTVDTYLRFKAPRNDYEVIDHAPKICNLIGVQPTKSPCGSGLARETRIIAA